MQLSATAARVVPSVRQRASVKTSTRERVGFAPDQATGGQRVRTTARDALWGRLYLVDRSLARRRSYEHLLEAVMPASHEPLKQA